MLFYDVTADKIVCFPAVFVAKGDRTLKPSPVLLVAKGDAH